MRDDVFIVNYKTEILTGNCQFPVSFRNGHTESNPFVCRSWSKMLQDSHNSLGDSNPEALFLGAGAGCTCQYVSCVVFTGRRSRLS